MRVGADLSYVFCTNAAAPVIKSYSPELIVFPLLDEGDRGLEEILRHLPRFHAIVIGPGLGRDKELVDKMGAIIAKVRELDIPMVLDADALWFISQQPDAIRGYAKTILTPNQREFDNLYSSVLKNANGQNKADEVKIRELCQELKVTILRKGRHEFISDGDKVVKCTMQGSSRRCGGQGDLMAGAAATFAFWAHQKSGKSNVNVAETGLKLSSNVLACFAASALTRKCNKLAFELHGRHFLLSDMIAQIDRAFKEVFKK